MCTVSTAVKAMCKTCSRLCGVIRIRFKLNIRVFFLLSSFIFVYCVADKNTGQRTSKSTSRVSIPYLLKAAKHCFLLLRVSVLLFLIFCSMFIHSFTCTNTAAFNFTDLHGTCLCRFIFMQRGFTVVCIPWIQAAEVPFNNHTAVMSVTILLNFIVMVYQTPAAPVILFVQAIYMSAFHCLQQHIVILHVIGKGKGIVN